MAADRRGGDRSDGGGELIGIDQLRYDEQNAVRHSPENLAAIRSSLEQLGAGRSIVIDDENRIVAGNGTVAAAIESGEIKNVRIIETDGTEIVAVKRTNLTDATRAALALADNRASDLHSWSEDVVRQLLTDFDGEIDFDSLALSPEDVDAMTAEATAVVAGLMPDVESDAEPEPDRPAAENAARTQDDRAAPDADELRRKWAPSPRQMWSVEIDGVPHRVGCIDSTDADAVGQLCEGWPVSFWFADPPYGMGKQADGVANDNRRREELTAFLSDVWTAWAPHLIELPNLAAWGNAPELWRWYYKRWASVLPEHVASEVVWNKGATAGIGSDTVRNFTAISERALIVQTGRAKVTAPNASDFYEPFEPLRQRLHGRFVAAGIDRDMARQICGVDMFSHWTSRSQFRFVPEKHYRALRHFAPEHFADDYAQLRAEFNQVHADYLRHVGGVRDTGRSYFGRADSETVDVINAGRVRGAERWGHPTPKPVDLLRQFIRLLTPPDGVVAEPFGGSGSTLIAAAAEGRRCVVAELQPSWVAVILERAERMGGTCKRLQ